MRKINYHKVHDTDNRFEITAFGENEADSPALCYEAVTVGNLVPACRVFFDGGTRPGGLTEGITEEVLLAILIDRLTNKLDEPAASKSIYNALRNCTLALETLHAETREKNHNSDKGELS